jgi:hypothetical protein
MADDGKDSSRSAILMIQAGLCLSVLGAAAVGLWWLRLEALPAYEQRLAHEQLLAQADQARGTQALREYHGDEWIRVREFAPAKTSDGTWVGVEEDSVLVVHNAQATDARDGWLFTNQLGESVAHPLMVHASFVERYDPLILEHGLELSNCRPVRRYESDGSVHYSVSGQLRNGTDHIISQCEVICQLHDSAGQSMVELKSPPMAIKPGGFAQFETSQAGENIGIMAFSLRVRYVLEGQAEESSQVLVSPRTPQETPR